VSRGRTPGWSRPGTITHLEERHDRHHHPAQAEDAARVQHPDTYAAYDLERRTHGPAASRPQGALQQTLSADLPAGIVMSPVYHGEPEAVTEAVLADPGLSIADELVLFLPPAFGLAQNVQLLTDLARTVAPALEWTPAR
jgi:hypothetical protein